MEDQNLYPLFNSAAQRVVHSYMRALADLTVCLPAGLSPQDGDAMETAQRDLHAFFKTMYAHLFQSPEDFGIPFEPDGFIEGDEHSHPNLKAELNKKFQKARDFIAFGLDFLRMLGRDGRLTERGMILDRQIYADFMKTAKKKKLFLNGLQKKCGLQINEDEAGVVVHSELFPGMMPALKSLAEACALMSEENEARLNFARCDFRALDHHYHPAAVDLYKIFTPVDYQRMLQLHDFLASLDYKPIIHIYAHMGWEVQYQGKRKVKASPLVRIEYSERFLNPLRVNIKCASADRLIPLIYSQSETLRKDFLSRTNTCREDECGWCRNRKNLGPSLYDYDGEQRKICWYTNPDFRVFDDTSVALIEEYTLFHEGLAKA